MFRQPAWLCLHFASCVVTQQNATFLGLRIQAGGYDLQIQTPQRFLYNAPNPKFHHPMFAHLEVIVLTNKQTDPHKNKQIPAKTSNVLRYATTLGKYSLVRSYNQHVSQWNDRTDWPQWVNIFWHVTRLDADVLPANRVAHQTRAGSDHGDSLIWLR